MSFPCCDDRPPMWRVAELLHLLGKVSELNTFSWRQSVWGKAATRHEIWIPFCPIPVGESGVICVGGGLKNPD